MSRYEQYEIKNNVFWTIWTPISSLATTVQLEAWQWARFSANMLATLEHIENNKVKKREIVKITNVSWDSLTIIRKYAQCPSDDDANTQWQVSFSFDIGDTLSAYIDKEHFTQISPSINDLMNNWNDRLRVKPTWWLDIEITNWNVRVWSQEYFFIWWTATLTNNATNYVMLDWAWIIQIDTTWRNQQYVKIATIITSWWEITSIHQWKMDTVGWQMWWAAWFKNITSTVYTKWLLTQFIADGEQYDLTYQNGRVKTITSGEKTYTMTYRLGRLVWTVES